MSDIGKKYWALVPVAGEGTRLRPHTHTRPKPLLQVAGQPIIGHIIEQLALAGIDRIVLVVGYMGDRIVDYVRSRGIFSRVEFVEQEEMLGLGHAVSLCRPVIGDDPALIVYGDTIFQAELSGLFSRRHSGSLGVKRVEDPRRFGVVVEEGDKVVRLLEKPQDFVSDRAIVGVNLIEDTPLLFACLRQLIEGNVRTRNEFQLTDALQLMVENGADLRTFPVEKWFDCGTQDAMLETNRHLLVRNSMSPEGYEGVIIPPVHIDPTAKVEGSVVGPYVSVGANAEVRGAIVRDAIVGEEAVVADIVLEHSLIGFQAAVRGRPSQLNVGDLSQITT